LIKEGLTFSGRFADAAALEKGKRPPDFAELEEDSRSSLPQNSKLRLRWLLPPRRLF
jgi:hypothetical protein